MKAWVSHDGELLETYAIPDDLADGLNADLWARRYARETCDATVEESCNRPSSYIPCGGDFTVTVAEETDGPFGAVCWMSRHYYFDASEGN